MASLTAFGSPCAISSRIKIASLREIAVASKALVVEFQLSTYASSPITDPATFNKVVFPVFGTPKKWTPQFGSPESARISPASGKQTANWSRQLPMQRFATYLFQSSRSPDDANPASTSSARTTRCVLALGLYTFWLVT